MRAPTRSRDRRLGRNAPFAYVGAAVAVTGVQLIAPALPAMRDALGLTDAQLSLVTSVYLLPAVVAAIPAGLAADKMGRRRVYGTALCVFGAIGLVLPLLSGSLTVFLAARFVQGSAFAAVLPLSMTILGDAYRGRDLVGALGTRSVSMSLGDAVFPVIGGVLVGLGWFVPWLVQGIALPLGVLALLLMKDEETPSTRSRAVLRTVLRLWRNAPIVALEYAGFLRMWLKFCILTYLPILLVDIRGTSAAFAGAALGVAAFSGSAMAALSGRLAGRRPPTRWIALGMGVMGLALVLVSFVSWRPALFASVVLYGSADGLMGVFVNSLVTAATGVEQRASFVAVTGAVRNFGKFLAPAVFGALVLLVPVPIAFAIVGGVGALSAVLTPLLRPLEERLVAPG